MGVRLILDAEGLHFCDCNAVPYFSLYHEYDIMRVKDELSKVMDKMAENRITATIGRKSNE